MEEVESPARRRLHWTGISLRVTALHDRWARPFWIVHSIWALCTGIFVLVLAHNRYGYVAWVIGFLGLTWVSTLFFSKRVAVRSDSRAARLAQGFVSYLTRIMYQETLFFLLPFYFYSTTFPSWNSAFVVGLGALAVFSCADIPFDRRLRTSRPFALGFFAIVTFAALQLFLPLVLSLHVHLGAYLAAVIALAAAGPLAFPLRELRQPATLLKIAVALLIALVATRLLRPVIPPVPLRLSKLRFATEIDPRTMKAPVEYTDTIPLSALAGGRLHAIATVYSPSRLPVAVTLEFRRDGNVLRTSRTVNLVAHSRGFRVWDTMRPGAGGFTPGRYTVEVWTDASQLIGRASIRVVAK